jgi:hypothetical protein
MTQSWWAAAVEALERPQYGTSMHFPDCLGGGCTGCLPEVIEGEIVAGGPAPFGVIPGSTWDAAVGPSVIAGLLVDDDPDGAYRMWLNGHTPAAGGEWLFAVDGRADGSDRSIVFARVWDDAVRVHIPEVPR